MVKKSTIFIMFGLALFLASCDSGYYTATGEDGVTGTDGVKMDFIPGTTPSKVMEDEEYSMQLRIENKGTVDIAEGYLDFSFEKQMFELENQDDIKEFALSGDDGAFRGEDKVTEVKMRTKDTRMQNVDQTSTTIKINACYEYGTRFEGTMCIDTNINSDASSKPCTMSSISGGQGQGAPVVIDQVDSRATTGSDGINFNFDIYVRNAASGTVLRPGSSERICTSELASEDFGVIDISEIALSKYRLSEGSITCQSHTDSPNQFDLSHQRDYISCRITEEVPYDLGTFTTPISIRLDYGYLQSIEKDLTVLSRYD
ncbi:MAG: hypothetical protein ACLFTR_04920 [Candidatus Woesearchaeota archaeon]